MLSLALKSAIPKNCFYTRLVCLESNCVGNIFKPILLLFWSLCYSCLNNVVEKQCPLTRDYQVHPNSLLPLICIQKSLINAMNLVKSYYVKI